MLVLTSRGPAETSAVPPLRIGNRGVVIGRAANVDLVLADPRSIVSSRHCSIEFHAGGYILTDTSTNGTAINGRRLTAPHRLCDGDIITIGPWQVGVSLVAGNPAELPSPPRADLENWNRPVSATSVTANSPPASTTGHTLQQMAQPPAPRPLAPPPPGADAVTQLLHAAGIPRSAVGAGDAAVLAAAGALLRQFGTGLMAMLEARARARTELGVKPGATSSNPLKRPGKPEPTLAQLLGAPAAAERAVAEAFAELDAHQRATLKAMQGALRTTLDELAPAAIRQHHGNGKIRGKGDAALWQAYEKAFVGSGSDSSFIDVFARELGAAYEKLAR